MGSGFNVSLRAGAESSPFLELLADTVVLGSGRGERRFKEHRTLQFPCLVDLVPRQLFVAHPS
jgi:hypothetical protein